MISKTKLTLIALAVLTLVGGAVAQVFTPSDFGSYSPPPVGVSSNPCNNGGPTAPQEFGHGNGDADDSAGTNYHRYANDNVIGGLDGAGASAFAGPLPNSISVGACTDGEFEYSSNAAFLNVRTSPGPNGGDGLTGCLADAFVQAGAHHGADTTVVVMDAVHGGNVGITLLSDWARPASTSNSGQDGNTISGQKHCGDGVVAPCNWDAAAGFGTRDNNNGSPHAGLQADLRRGDILAGTNGNPGSFVSDLNWLTTNVPTTNDQIDEWNQYRVGCNPLDFAEYDAEAVGASNEFDPSGATLAGFGHAGYTGGAAGYLIALVAFDNPGGFDNSDDTTATAGWVWTY